MPLLNSDFILPFNDRTRTVAERTLDAEAVGWDDFIMPEGVYVAR